MEEFRTKRNAVLCISCIVLKLNHGILAESGVVKTISNGQQCLDLSTLYHLTGFIQQSIFKVTKKLLRKGARFWSVIYAEKRASCKETTISAEFVLHSCSLTARTLAITSHFFLSSHSRYPSGGSEFLPTPISLYPEHRSQSWLSRPPAPHTIFFLKFPLPQTRMLSSPSASSSRCFFSRSKEVEHSLRKTRE